MPTAADDLESFFGGFIWAYTHILEHHKSRNPWIDYMKKAPGEKDLVQTIGKREMAKQLGRDVVFGGLIRDWMGIFDSVTADMTVDSHARRVTETQEGSLDRERAYDELELLCNKLYGEILESGYKHLEIITTGGYSRWNSGVEENFQAERSSRAEAMRQGEGQ